MVTLHIFPLFVTFLSLYCHHFDAFSVQLQTILTMHICFIIVGAFDSCRYLVFPYFLSLFRHNLDTFPIQSNYIPRTNHIPSHSTNLYQHCVIVGPSSDTCRYFLIVTFLSLFPHRLVYFHLNYKFFQQLHILNYFKTTLHHLFKIYGPSDTCLDTYFLLPILHLSHLSRYFDTY